MNNAQRIVRPHEDCDAYEPCTEGKPDECPRKGSRDYIAKGKAGAWSTLELRREPGGLRHYLDGKPIHCGEGIELQTREDRYDDPDGNGYTMYLQKGIVVRYEATQDGREIRGTLHADVSGYEFECRLGSWMRFRWPQRSGR